MDAPNVGTINPNEKAASLVGKTSPYEKKYFQP